MTSVATTPSGAASLSRARIVGARSLTILGLFLLLISLLAVFVRYELLDRGTFRGTSTRLLESRPIQSQIATSAVDALYSNVDVAAEIRSRLPQAQKGLAFPISAAFRSLAERVATQLLARPVIQQRVVHSLDLSHEQLVRLLKNKGRFGRAEGGVVYLDVTKLVDTLAARLGLPRSVAEKLPASATRVVLIQSDELGTAQRGVRLLDFLASWLWVFVLTAWTLAVYLVPGRRRLELRAIAIGLVAIGLLVLLLRRAVGTYVVDHLASTASVKPAASDAYAIVTRNLRDAGRTDLAVGLFALIGIWLAGPGERARVTLRWFAPYLRRPALVYGIYALAWLVLLAWGPTVQFRRPWYVLLMLLLGAVGLELLRRLAQRRYPNVEPTSIAASLEQWWASFGTQRTTPSTSADSAREAEHLRPAPLNVADLEALAALHDAGNLTSEEFSTAKQRVLA